MVLRSNASVANQLKMLRHVLLTHRGYLPGNPDHDTEVSFEVRRPDGVGVLVVHVGKMSMQYVNSLVDSNDVEDQCKHIICVFGGLSAKMQSKMQSVHVMSSRDRLKTRFDRVEIIPRHACHDRCH